MALALTSIMLVGFDSRAAADTLSVTVAATAEWTGESLEVRVSISNDGDATAATILPTLVAGGRKVAGSGTPQLAPKQTHEEVLRVNLGRLSQGVWPYHILVDHADAGGYPLQALHASTFVVGASGPTRMIIEELEPRQLSARTDLELHVRNMGPDKRRASVRVLTPLALDPIEPTRAVELDPWARKRVVVRTLNRTARIGDVLPVVAVLEYDDPPHHQTVLARGMVSIVAEEPMLARVRLPLTLAGGLLALGWLGFVIVRRRRTAKPAS